MILALTLVRHELGQRKGPWGAGGKMGIHGTTQNVGSVIISTRKLSRLVSRISTPPPRVIANPVSAYESEYLILRSCGNPAVVNNSKPPVKGFAYCTSDPLISNVDLACTMPAST